MTPLVTSDTTTITTTIEGCTIDTPPGPLSILSSDSVVMAAGFTTVDELWDRLDHPDLIGHDLVITDDLGPISTLVREYLDGRVDALEEVTVDQPGTDLQREVWDGLRRIPAGQTRTYTELAAMTSNPRAVRAAGTACGRNLIAPFVPCHRALRSDGSLGGYYYGLDAKRWLLAHEAG